MGGDYNVENIPIDDVFVVGERRPVSDDAVAALVASIERIGLQTPITVRGDDTIPDPDTGEIMGGFALVAGRHRLEAYRRLGKKYIPAIVRDCDAIDAELWEIAENLHRADLTKAERDKQIRRYAGLLEDQKAKRAAELLQSRQSVVIESKRGDGRGHKPEGTASRIAKETGLSKRTVERALNPQPPRPAAPKPAPVPLTEEETQEQWLAAMMRLWNRAPDDWRSAFLGRVAS